MIPEVSREVLLEALVHYDPEFRDRPGAADWEENPTSMDCPMGVRFSAGLRWRLR